jgi:predicted acylesterase/phospholipase RssA
MKTDSCCVSLKAVTKNAKGLLTFISISAIVLAAMGCALKAYTNEELAANQTNNGIRATYKVENRAGSQNNALVILALSGGGSRAALFSSLVMLALDEIQVRESTLLKEVDAISSVSGGSLAAAYYAISKDPGPTVEMQDRIWDRDTATELMSRNYLGRWIANWFWPKNIFYYWFTAYNRSDIMATTFADNFLDTRHIGTDYKFRDIDAARPTLLINSTIGTSGEKFGEVFTFTVEKFNCLKSDLANYDIARAVMASASFPSVFNYMHLRDYRFKDKKYTHLFDGGNSDNLGLKTVFGILDNTIDRYDTIILILVDVFTSGGGVSAGKPDGRDWPIDFIADTNFIDSFDSLLSRNRENLVENGINYFEWLKKDLKKNVIFYHIKFDNLRVVDKALYKNLNSIKTDFKIGEPGIEALKKASALLMTDRNECLTRIIGLLSGRDSNFESTYCTWPALGEDMHRIQRAPQAPVSP